MEKWESGYEDHYGLNKKLAADYAVEPDTFFFHAVSEKQVPLRE